MGFSEFNPLNEPAPITSLTMHINTSKIKVTLPKFEPREI